MTGGIWGNQVVAAGTRLSGSQALRIVLGVWKVPQRLSKAEMLRQWQSLHSPEPEEISRPGDEAVGVRAVTPSQGLTCVLLMQLSSNFNQEISWQLRVLYQTEMIFEAMPCTPASFPLFYRAVNRCLLLTFPLLHRSGALVAPQFSTYHN